VSFPSHVAGRSFVAWSLCPTARLARPGQPMRNEKLDGTIKPARFLEHNDAVVTVFYGSDRGMAQSRTKEKFP
jgi:hypothetical protein